MGIFPVKCGLLTSFKELEMWLHGPHPHMETTSSLFVAASSDRTYLLSVANTSPGLLPSVNCLVCQLNPAFI